MRGISRRGYATLYRSISCVGLRRLGVAAVVASRAALMAAADMRIAQGDREGGRARYTKRDSTAEGVKGRKSVPENEKFSEWSMKCSFPFPPHLQ